MADMLQEIKERYTLMYRWYREHADSAIECREKAMQEWHDKDQLEKYKNIVLGLIAPEDASLDNMVALAREAVMGELEFDFRVQVKESKTMGEIGREVLRLYEQRSIEEKMKDGCYGALPVEAVSRDSYIEQAAAMYEDVPFNSDKSIGGRVAVADTNWEFEQIGRQKGWLRFRKPALLHFALVKEEENLFELASSGKIEIESIMVKK